jgi:hypothetical protein
MKLNLVTTSALCLLSSLFIATPLSRVLAQDPPATTYKSGFWQPVADFDTNQKVTVKLINQTKIPISMKDVSQVDLCMIIMKNYIN